MIDDKEAGAGARNWKTKAPSSVPWTVVKFVRGDAVAGL